MSEQPTQILLTLLPNMEPYSCRILVSPNLSLHQMLTRCQLVKFFLQCLQLLLTMTKSSTATNKLIQPNDIRFSGKDHSESKKVQEPGLFSIALEWEATSKLWMLLVFV